MKTTDILVGNLRDLYAQFKNGGGNQATFATKVGASQGQVSVWLRGGYVPGVESLDGIAAAFNIQASDLLLPNAAQKAFGQNVEKIVTEDQQALINLILEHPDEAKHLRKLLTGALRGGPGIRKRRSDTA